MNYKYLRQGFTLVELLVVIAIVGILSGLIIVGMSSSVQSATIAKAQVFSNSLRNSILANLVSEWKFDDSVNLGKDSWSSNDCVATGTPVQATTGCMYDDCLSLNGTANYLSCTNTSALQITGDQTIEMWLYPTDLTARRNPFHKRYGGEGSIVQEIAGYFNYIYGTSGTDGSPYEGFSSTATVQANNWYHIVVTRSLSASPKTVKWYINGKQTSSNTTSYSAAVASTAPILLGAGYTNPYYGKIDNVRIYSAAIPASQIKEIYYLGLNRMLKSGIIDNEEYSLKISNLIN